MNNKFSCLTRNISNKMYEYFPLFFHFDLEGTPYIVGGFLRSIILNKNINDLDIVILNGNNDNLEVNLKKEKLSYYKNKFNGYRIIYDNKKIDIWCVNDLNDAIEYNIEQLFFNIYNNNFVDLGFIEAIKTNEFKEINEKNRGTNYLKRKQKILREFNELTNKIGYMIS